MLLIMLAFAVWTILLRSILRPVDTVKQAMKEIEHGNQEKVEIHGEHEIWLLAAEYNRMLDALREQHEMLQKEYQEKVEMSERRTGVTDQRTLHLQHAERHQLQRHAVRG